MTKQQFLDYCLRTYATTPDYPFDDWMESAVLRHADNQKKKIRESGEPKVHRLFVVREYQSFRFLRT